MALAVTPQSAGHTLLAVDAGAHWRLFSIVEAPAAVALNINFGAWGVAPGALVTAEAVSAVGAPLQTCQLVGRQRFRLLMSMPPKNCYSSSEPDRALAPIAQFACNICRPQSYRGRTWARSLQRPPLPG